ncbi:MAG: hypothetical protein ACTSPY_02580 [Candidatus Helarchaeota archaeon]
MYNKFRKRHLIIYFIFLILIINFYIVLNKGNQVKSISMVQLEYEMLGREIEISNNQYYIGNNFISEINIDMNISDETIEMSYHEVYQLYLWTSYKNEIMIIDRETGLDQYGNYPIWVLNDFNNQKFFSTNYSTLQLTFIKSHKEAIQLAGFNSLILTQVYCYSLNKIYDSLRICFYYDINSGILLKVDVSIVKNLITTNVITCTLINTNFEGLSYTSPIEGLFYNVYIYIAAVIIGIIVGIIVGKILYSYKRGDNS